MVVWLVGTSLAVAGAAAAADANTYARSPRLEVGTEAPASTEPPSSRVPHGCTVVTAVRGGQVIFAGNDDYVDRDTVYWVDPAGPGRYGAIWIGPRDNVQHGFNEKGLAYDANGLPPVTTKPHRERAAVAGGYSSYPIEILRTCATVEDVIAWVRAHQWHERTWDQLHFADASGDAVIIGADADGELVFTRKVEGDGFLVSTNFNVANPANGNYPCPRYELATRMLGEIRRAGDLTRGHVAAIMEATHVARPSVWTKVTFVADLVTRTVDIYYFHQFDRPITLQVDDELARRPADAALSTLFPRETLARADAAYERLTKSARRGRLLAGAWLAIALACGVVIWMGMAGAAPRRRAWTFAGVLLGPIALAAWLAAGPKDRAGDHGGWRAHVAEMAALLPACVTGTTLAFVVLILSPAARQSEAGQLTAVYGLPMLLGLVATWLGHGRSTPVSSILLQAIVAGHLALSGIWLTTLMAIDWISQLTGAGPTTVALAWATAAGGALIGAAPLSLYLSLAPPLTWRQSWWWVPVSLAALVLGSVLGLSLRQLLAALPVLASIVAAVA